MNKKENLASKIQIIISQALLEEVNNPMLKEVTVTSVEMINGGDIANVYYSILNEGEEEAFAYELKKATSFFSQIVSKNLTVRKAPKIVFIYDLKLKHLNEVDEMFKKIK